MTPGGDLVCPCCGTCWLGSCNPAFCSNPLRSQKIEKAHGTLVDGLVHKLDDMFSRQRSFMDDLAMADKLPEYPVDLSQKGGQRLIKEMIANLIFELAEAQQTLKNKAHRVTDDREFDRAHYLEELGDALAYFLEVCIMSGVTADELYEEYVRKNAIVRERLREGY